VFYDSDILPNGFIFLSIFPKQKILSLMRYFTVAIDSIYIL